MAENNKEYYSDEKPRMTCSLQKGVYARTNAMYGPWESIAAFEEWFAGRTSFDIPSSTEVGIINQTSGAVDTFIYNRTLEGTGYWKDDDGGIVLSEEDGNANNLLLNALLAEGNVKLKKGNYPVAPGVVVDNVTLDLNGSCLTCSVHNNKGLLQIKGEKPVVRNGELCGTFTELSDTPNHDPEDEGLIRCYLYGDALIENMELHNCQGYAICHGYPSSSEYSIVTIGTATEYIPSPTTTPLGDLTESRQFATPFKDIPTGFKYVLIRDSGTDNRVLAVRNVVFKFYDSTSNTAIRTVEEMPRVPVAIPEGATRIRVVVYRYTNYDNNTQLFFTNIETKCITIQNCCVHNNYRLGILGMAYGTQKILNCRSYGHGKPTKDSARVNTNTVAFFNAEDLCTPKLIMEGCTSEDEACLALIGAYKATITGCTGGSITVYRGWNVNISNCVGSIGAFNGITSPVIINVSNCIITRNFYTSPNWVGNNNTFIDCNIYDITKENNFIIRREHRTSGTTGVNQTPAIKGLVRGKIYNAHVTSGNEGIRRVATAPGSNFEYVWNNASNASDISHGTIAVSGDCYGITANCPFYPNGKKIYNSTFTPVHSFGAKLDPGTETLNNCWSGEYVNCTFNISTGAMFYCDSNKYGISGSNKTLIFRNCTINIAEAASGATQLYLFRKGLKNATEKNFKVKFINCTIDNPNFLFHSDANNIPYEIITYDDSIDALLARIEALENNS